MYRLWNENNVKSSKVVSLRQNKSHSPLNLEKLKIITYNTNGLRAAVGKGLPEWLAQEQPDVLCIQETKLQPDQFPSETFEALGYKSYLFSAKRRDIVAWPFLRNRNRIISSMEWGSRSMIMRDVSPCGFRGLYRS